MKDAAFTTRRAPDWEELDALLRRAGTRPERLGPEGVLRLGALYRTAAADLAFARRALPQDPARRRLEELVARGRRAVYANERCRARPLDFLAGGYWRAVAGRPAALALATALFVIPAALALVWALSDIEDLPHPPRSQRHRAVPPRCSSRPPSSQVCRATSRAERPAAAWRSSTAHSSAGRSRPQALPKRL